MRKKREKLFSKIMMITFLVLVVIGFTVPGFLNANNESIQTSTPAEQRLCSTDADCYLSCPNGPVSAVCVQNLCQKNSCDEATLYPVLEQPISFALEINVNGSNIDLSTLVDQKNFITAFSGSKVNLFTKNLQLEQIFERLGLRFTADCLYFADKSYCTSQEMELTMLVNGQPISSSADYVPQQDDQIKITYQKIKQ